jgi:hypothetical protein
MWFLNCSYLGIFSLEEGQERLGKIKANQLGTASF